MGLEGWAGGTPECAGWRPGAGRAGLGLADMAEESGIDRATLTAGDRGAHDPLEAYRLMYLSRRLDDREIILKRRNQIYFQVSAAGHEAVQTAAGLLLRPGTDWCYPYYRDRALCLALGVSPLDMLLQAVGSSADQASGGRQMPSHWSSPALNIVSASSPTGTQFLQAVGCAHASRLMGAGGKGASVSGGAGGSVSDGAGERDDAVVLVCSGDGATSEGEFWEALNAACLERLPVVFLIEDNEYAISVPIEAQTAGGAISKLAASFPDLAVEEVDGLDYFASRRGVERAIGHCRSGRGPALVHAHTIRLYAHSLSDNESLYKPPEELAREVERDPLRRFADQLVEQGFADEHAIFTMHHDVDIEVHQAVESALAADQPAVTRPVPGQAPLDQPGQDQRGQNQAAEPAQNSITKYLYSPLADPASEEFDSAPRFQGDPKTMVDLINLCLKDEMRRNPRMVVFGEDVADCTRAEHLDRVKGKGGVFKVTAGLQREFGSERVFNSPLAEAAIAGRAIGMATRGLKPVVEIQFFDYIWPAMMQIRNELATLRWRSHNGFRCPVVIRAPIGGYLGGGGIYHSQSGEVLFTHIPGLRVVFPSNAADANGLLRTAIRCDDPVLFLEHKKLYRETYNRNPYPGPDYMIPFGCARKVREGSGLTVVTYGALVQRSMRAAKQVEARTGQSIEILDLRTLSPYDWKAIAASVRKTSRALVVHEDCLSFGYGAEIAARIGGELFDCLDAPVGRVGAMDVWVAYNPKIENEILPQVGDLEREMERVLWY